MLFRERQEKVAVWRLDVMVRALLAEMPPAHAERLAHLLSDEYAQYVFQTVHDPNVIRARLREKISELRTDRQRAKKIEQMG